MSNLIFEKCSNQALAVGKYLRLFSYPAFYLSGFNPTNVLKGRLRSSKLTAFMVERRSKEIAIRKTLGCSDLGIISLLSTFFIRIIFIAIAVAFPLGYFLMGEAKEKLLEKLKEEELFESYKQVKVIDELTI
jgi:hypothetical protein